MIEPILYEYMREMLGQVTHRHFRYLYHKISWDARMIGIVGPRGVGKSTMVLQHIKKSCVPASALYVAADNVYFNNHTLLSLADDFVKDGGNLLVIDEIHKYKHWSRELKTIYDVHPKLHIIFTGSSILDIKRGEADLSRRALMYEMQGLSFREYLLIFHGIEAPVFSLHDIVNHRVELPGLEHPLPYFRKYLEQGYYPFCNEPGFIKRLDQVVQQTVDTDIAQYADIKPATARRLKQLLAVISRLAPFKPSFDSLAQEVGVSKNNVPDYLVYLQQAGMIDLLRDDTAGLRALGKIEKVYIDNPSLMTVLAANRPDIGNLRETFFLNQMRVENEVRASRESDFFIAPYTFEVGGKRKGKKQIENVNNGIVVRDDIEFGAGIVVPLWHFGLNY
ncbi:MAG: ATP-binding protein [Muribaculaceae bacterium]